MGGATTLLTATMTTAWGAATRSTAGHLEWNVVEAVSEEGVTAATGAEPSTPSTQHSQWASVATKIKVGFGVTATNGTLLLNMFL